MAKPRLVWENPNLTAGTQKKKQEVKPNSSYGRVLYNYYRYYDPNTGRYITSDPIGLDGGLNTYGYVYQNPIIYFDEYGLRGGCGPGWKPVPMPGQESAYPKVSKCVRDPYEDPNKKICANANCGAELPPVPIPEPCGKCRAYCILGFFNPFPDEGDAAEDFATAAGNSIREEAGQVAGHVTKSVNRIKGAFDFFDCMEGCKKICNKNKCESH